MALGTDGGSALSLADFLAQGSGDGGYDLEESPGESASSSAASSPLAEPAAPSAVPAPVPDGAAPDALAGSPPADAATPAPDAGVTPPEPDPLATATAATYTVDGQSRTYDAIKVLGEDGAVIAAADLPDLLTRLGERDHLLTRSRDQHETTQRYERLATWKTQGPDGQPITYEGQRGIVEMRLDRERLAVENSVYESLFRNPDQLVAMLAQDAAGKWVLDADRLRSLALEARHQQREAEDRVRGQIQQLVVAPPAPPAAVDYRAHAPALITQIAGSNATHLTAEDRQTLTAQLPFYVRDAAPGEAHLNGKTVDPQFAVLVTRLAAQNAAAKAAAATRTTADVTNAARIAAASRTPAPVAPVAPAQPPAPANDSVDRWDFMHNLAAKGMR